MRKNKIKKHSIVSGVLLNLTMTVIFIFFIILGNENTTRSTSIQEDTYQTHFQSRLILKSINGLNNSRFLLLRAITEKNEDLLWEAEDLYLGSFSNYKILLSEQKQNKGHLSQHFYESFEELGPLFIKVSESDNPLLENELLTKTKYQLNSLIEKLFQEESLLWVEESMKFARFAQFKEKNLVIFFALIVLFILIQLGLIYFTVIRYKLNKKINQQNEQLILQTRLSTLGMMSAELAHEINSPLMVIDGRLKILQKELNAKEINKLKAQNNLDIISRNSGRIQSIIKSFKTLSKSGNNDQFEWVEVKKLFEEVNELVDHKINDEKIVIHYPIDFENKKLEIRKIQIIQVMTNLVNNSIEAIRNMEEKWIKIETEIEDTFFKIIVTDSGNGISPTEREHIFEPFYSTKNSYEGTGLGLSISKKIMREHNGDLIYLANNTNTQFAMIFKNKKTRD